MLVANTHPQSAFNSSRLTGPARNRVHMEYFHPTSPGSRLAQGEISPSRADPVPI